MTSPRVVHHSYRDPLSEIWIAAAYKMGMRVQRSEDAFAHYDGAGTLFIATDAHLDADDCLAQMIFHEMCHALVEGPDSFGIADWGLDNTSSDDDHREHATLRTQAVLAGRYGLRRVLAPTTDFRAFYDALPKDALSPRDAASTRMAIAAVRLSQTAPWWPHLEKALEATRSIISIASSWPAPASAPSLFRELQPALGTHASGLPAHPAPDARNCGDCAWLDASETCLQASRTVLRADSICERFEPPFDCQDCGACCRSAYHSVTITPGDVIERTHPSLLVVRDSYTELRREGDHCAALRSTEERHACSIYDDRPTCCREFENAGINCVTARRRLSFTL